MKYRHPLLDVAESHEWLPPSRTDETPEDFPRTLSRKHRLKLEIGRLVYPIKNRLERSQIQKRLEEVGVSINGKPDLLAWGQRGFDQTIFVDRVAECVGREKIVGCFGCGDGYELLNLARSLKPRKIIGLEYQNYNRAWKWVKSELAKLNVEAEFIQCDLRLPLPPFEKVDLIISFAVLEHLHDIPLIFSNLRPALNSKGIFAAIWGPLWYSYSGDHIAAVLGFEHGYDHVLLSPEDYLEWYYKHPRNVPYVEAGKPTWLEMGLASYAQYVDYIEEIERFFGAIKWLGWSVSPEGYEWRKQYPERWREMLENNPHLEPLDLLLDCVAVIASSDQ